MKHFIIYITITILAFGKCYSQGNQEEELIETLYTIENIEATIPFDGEFGSANLVIHLVSGNIQITRPLIVAEGFDIGSAINPELKYGSFNYLDFYPNK